MKHISAILLSALLLQPWSVRAQGLHYRVSEMPTQRQMPVANVHCLLQDSEGFMWYGTTGGGLCRDNGYQIDVFRVGNSEEQSLPSNDITCLAEDARGGIWAGTAKGVCRIDKRDYRVTPMLTREMNGRRINDILCDSRSQVWVSGNGCVARLDSTLHLCKVYTFDDVIGESVFEDRQGRLWLGLWNNGLMRYDAASDSFLPQPWPSDMRPSRIMGITEGSNGILWISTWGHGILSYDAATGHAEQQAVTLGSDDKRAVLDCLRDSRQGLLWVTTLDNLYIFREENGRLFSAGPSPVGGEGGKILDKLAEDKDGNIWVAGFSPRTRIISPLADHTVRHEVRDMMRLTGYHLMPDRIIGDGDAFWIWQGRWGLTRFTPSDGRVTDAGGHRYSQCMARCDNRPGIWAAEGRTLVRLTAEGEQQRLSLDSLSPTALVEKDGALWIGTESAVLRYGILGGRLERVCSTDGPVTAIVADAGNRPYFIEAGKGLCNRDGLVCAGRDFTALAVAGNGALWFASEQGKVYTLESGRAVADTLASDERGDAVRALLFDASDHLWVLSDLRLKEVNPRLHSMRIIRPDDPSVGMGYFYSLTPYDGHRVIVSGDGAFCLMESSSDLNRTQSLARCPMVTAVQTTDTMRLVGRGEHTVTLPAAVGPVALHLSTLEHLHASGILFAYRLCEGDEWIYLPPGSNTVVLSRLPRGRHTLLVKCTDSGGCWGEPVGVITLDRLAYWWETWWARLLFALLTLGLLWGLRTLSRRIRLLHELQQKRKEIVLTEIELNPSELKSSKIDSDFLQKAVQTVERHIGDGAYSVKRFAGDMCMSRMNLYRRLHLLTGLSPVEFMRDIRLKKAAQIMLSHPDAPINEVAAMVGFTTPSYFSQCFRKMFGVLPTQYVRSQASRQQQAP